MPDEMKKIIVVDDNMENLTAIKRSLKDIYEVYPVPSAKEMFELMEHVMPNLILLDVEMPEMNGYDTARKLKSNDKLKDIPIIFLTSMDDTKSEMEGLNIGAVDYIHKPFISPLLIQRIKTHLALIDHQIEAQKASRAKGQFLAHMSHEIRTPLNAIIGMINIAANTDDMHKIKHSLKNAINASRHLMSLINDILDMSKIEADKFELSYGVFNFKNMLTDILNVTNVRAEEKKITLSINPDDNIPEHIIGDELRLSQVIINLITNAIKFTPEKGSVTLEARMLEEKEDDIILKIEVKDTGIGISEEQQKKLFSSYSQADSSITRNFGGTGLGLVISKRIIEMMSGKIWVESQLHKGSKFIFTITAKKGKGGNAANGELTETSFNFSGHTILVAEDVDINREIVASLLEKTNITIDFAEDGEKALSMFTENPDKYSLILMDVNMPQMSGYDVTGKIRALEAKDSRKPIPIIAMTADVFTEDIEKCKAAGMNDHIGKPIDTEILHKTLKKYLN